MIRFKKRKRTDYQFDKRTEIEIIYEIVKAIVENGPQSFGRLKGFTVVRLEYFRKHIATCLIAGLIIKREIHKDRKKKYEYLVTEKGR